MRYLFGVTFAALVIATVATYALMPDVRTDVPVVYWVTDPNPARVEQIEIFHEWLRKHDYPQMECRTDTANREVSKMIIQGVSGVGGEIMDLGSGGGVRYFHSVGLLRDVTEEAKEFDFDTSRTFAAMEPELTVDGRQYAFPCNVYAHMYWINEDTFDRYDQPLPPKQWDFETFERMGKEFVDAANRNKKRRMVFYANQLPTSIMRRSVGLSVFNETLSECILDDPRNEQILKLLYKWTYEDRILPSAADQESFSTEHGYGGATLQLFNNGNYAMFLMGRYALIQMREFGALELAVTEPPHGGFRNTATGTRCAGIYKGSEHSDLAVYFLSYLASEDYNMQIVRDADALPPNPKYTEIEEFRRPEKYPNEWGCHEPFAHAAETIAIGGAYSPFVLQTTVQRIDRETTEGFMSDIYTAQEAAERAAEKINDEIERTLEEQPALRILYRKRQDTQRKIEKLRAAGEKVPLEWIDNPFYRRYYKAKGWAK